MRSGYDRGSPVMVKTYEASCHCGRVRIEADVDLAQPSFRCNCSICRRTRMWVAVAMPEGFRHIAGQEELIRYVFGREKNEHFFCRHCGVRVFGVGNETPIGKMYGINIGCLQGVSEEELSKISITYVDGMHDRWESTPEFHSQL
jgi:hypothetical protein